MDELQEGIINAMESWSTKGKNKVSIKDISKKIGVTQRELNKGIKVLIESSALSYWHSGSSTYIMLQSNYEKLKEVEST